MKPFSGQATDNCPSWAKALIEKLLLLEMELGNIPPASDWSEEMLEKLQKRAAENPEANSDVCQQLFERIGQGLKKDGFSSQQIAAFINARIGYSGGPAYCNASEVDEI